MGTDATIVVVNYEELTVRMVRAALEVLDGDIPMAHLSFGPLGDELASKLHKLIAEQLEAHQFWEWKDFRQCYDKSRAGQSPEKG